jgi:serine/threonine-protein kinase
MTTEHGALEPSTTDSVVVRDRYRIIGPGVAGAETVVYDGEDVVTGRPLAISIVRGAAARDTEFVAAVREQAFRLVKNECRHAALVQVHDVGNTDQGELFVALESVRGRSLREVLAERGTLGFHEGLRLAIEVGEALETLHRGGIVYGELRPESVLLVPGESGRQAAKLVGSELTAAHRTAEGLGRRDNTIVAYLAPEQLERAETSEAADIYALGLLILELLTGHRPDGGGARGAAEVPPSVARIVAKALEEAPGRRYSSISLMVNDMWTAESATRPSPQRAAGFAARRRTRRRMLTDVAMAIALVGGLILIGVTSWVVRADRQAHNGAPDAEPVVAASPVAPTLAHPAPPAAVAAPPTLAPVPPTPAPVAPALEPVAPAPSSPPAFAPSLPPRGEPVRAEAARVREERPPSARPAVVGTAVRAPRPVAPSPERPPSADQPSTAVGGDGAAIVDWLLKGRASD